MSCGYTPEQTHVLCPLARHNCMARSKAAPYLSAALLSSQLLAEGLALRRVAFVRRREASNVRSSWHGIRLASSVDVRSAGLELERRHMVIRRQRQVGGFVFNFGSSSAGRWHGMLHRRYPQRRLTVQSGRGAQLRKSGREIRLCVFNRRQHARVILRGKLRGQMRICDVGHHCTMPGRHGLQNSGKYQDSSDSRRTQ